MNRSSRVLHGEWVGAIRDWKKRAFGVPMLDGGMLEDDQIGRCGGIAPEFSRGWANVRRRETYCGLRPQSYCRFTISFGGAFRANGIYFRLGLSWATGCFLSGEVWPGREKVHVVPPVPLSPSKNVSYSLLLLLQDHSCSTDMTAKLQVSPEKKGLRPKATKRDQSH